MKKSILLGFLCLAGIIIQAQTVHDNELAIVYYMPQTQLCFDVEYEEVISQPGPFAAYAKQYLGATEIIKEPSRIFQLEKIHCRPQPMADYTRAYKVVAENGIESQLLTLSRIGTLEGYNIAHHEHGNVRKENIKHGPKTIDRSPNVLPLLEEHLNGKSVAQQAQGAAKLIYRIRENRMYLIGGEVEKVPADGVAMKLVLDELDKQERQLVELFVGKREVIKHREVLTYIPVKSEEVEIGYFSDKEGLTSSGNGEPILLNVTAKRQMKGNTHVENDKKAPAPSQIYYNLAGSANIKIDYLNETLLEKHVPVAQFGIAVPLSRTLFTKGDLPHIYFDIQTGGIKSIEK